MNSRLYLKFILLTTYFVLKIEVFDRFAVRVQTHSTLSSLNVDEITRSQQKAV